MGTRIVERGGQTGHETFRRSGGTTDEQPSTVIDRAMCARHFGDEFRIQLAWMRRSPPDTANPGGLFGTRVRQMKALPR